MKIKSLIGIVLLGAMFVSGAYAEVTTEHENVNGQSSKKREYRIRLPGGDLVGVQNAPDNQTGTTTPPATGGVTVINRPILSPIVAPVVTKSLTLAPLPPVAPVAPTVPAVPLKLMNPPVLTLNPVLPVVPPVVNPPVITALPILPVILPPPVPVIVIPPPPVVMLPPPIIIIPVVYVPPPRIPLKLVVIK
jgi:hypothetical protein